MARKNLGSVLRYTFGGFLLIGGVVEVFGTLWSGLLSIVIGLFILTAGSQRLLGVAVSRTADGDVVCRLLPWFHGWFYAGGVLLPLLGVAGLGMAQAGESLAGRGPTSLRIAGIFLIIAPTMLLPNAFRQWRRCRLGIGRSELTVGVIKPGPTPIVIRRDDVESIETERVAAGTQGMMTVSQVMLAYRSADAGATPKAIQFGIGPNDGTSALQLSVDAGNLARALTAWKDGSASDPELLDRVQALLRGRESTVEDD